MWFKNKKKSEKKSFLYILHTTALVYIKTMKTTFDLNLNFYQAFNQHVIAIIIVSLLWLQSSYLTHGNPLIWNPDWGRFSQFSLSPPQGHGISDVKCRLPAPVVLYSSVQGIQPFISLSYISSKEFIIIIIIIIIIIFINLNMFNKIIVWVFTIKELF